MSKALIAQSSAKLEEEGFKLTQARRAVIDALAKEREHLTAPQVVEAVGQRAPGVGRASVYRTLELLARLGWFIRPFSRVCAGASQSGCWRFARVCMLATIPQKCATIFGIRWKRVSRMAMP